MAGKKGQGNGPATRARAKRAASAQDKTEQLRDKFAKITKSQEEELKSRDLDKLTDWLGQHPRAADFIWKSVEAGAYDYLDSGDTNGTAEEEVLPAWQNKVSLLHPEQFVKPLLQELLPHLAEFFGRLKKVKKSDWAEVLGFVVNVDPSSALVTKKKQALLQWFKEQWVENRKRLSSWEPQDDDTTLEDIWKSNGYWSLQLQEDCGERILWHISGMEFKLPKVISADAVLVNAGNHHKAFLKDDVVKVDVNTIVKHDINTDVAKHLKAPYWLESVPMPKLGGGSQTTPTKSDATPSKAGSPSPSPPSTASPAKSTGAAFTASPPPPPSGFGGALASSPPPPSGFGGALGMLPGSNDPVVRELEAELAKQA